MKCFLILIFVTLKLSTCLSQVSLAPTTVFADQGGIGTLYVTNASSKAQEINISFLFGYPGNDSIGNLLMIYSDSIKEKISGLGDRIRTFPRSFTLAPGQQQTVRFQIRPDRSKPEGTYFTRVKVVSNELTSDVEVATTEGISTQVTFKFEQVIAAFYKYGLVATGLEFYKIEGKKRESSILINTEFKVTGNSPYLGSLQAEVKDNTGKIIATQQQTLALYYEGKRNYSISVPEDLPSGTYQVNLIFKTERSDISTSDLVQSPTDRKSVV